MEQKEPQVRKAAHEDSEKHAKASGVAQMQHDEHTSCHNKSVSRASNHSKRKRNSPNAVLPDANARVRARRDHWEHTTTTSRGCYALSPAHDNPASAAKRGIFAETTDIAERESLGGRT